VCAEIGVYLSSFIPFSMLYYFKYELIPTLARNRGLFPTRVRNKFGVNFVRMIKIQKVFLSA